MTISSLSAAKALCELSEWKFSNLVVQKILYIAHMVHLGKYDGSPLVDESFEAWDYGPVLPTVYRRAKPFGANPVKNVFRGISNTTDGTELAILTEAVNKLSNSRPGDLVAMTHRDGGAWARFYNPQVKGIIIPNSAIIDEYKGLINV
ncbi:MAG: DUF4065 domain-containing protein [Gammaproteobacteria bacterium]|nr:DUF4065 domain-containing protein [Gammaproteobacteria bacterium]